MKFIEFCDSNMEFIKLFKQDLTKFIVFSKLIELDSLKVSKESLDDHILKFFLLLIY